MKLWPSVNCRYEIAMNTYYQKATCGLAGNDCKHEIVVIGFNMLCIFFRCQEDH